MENFNARRASDGLIDPNRLNQPTPEKNMQIRMRKDGLMERTNGRVLTDDGRELLREDGSFGSAE